MWIRDVEQSMLYFSIMQGFESATCVPIATKAVDVALLTPDERNWLNAYNSWVYGLLHELLPPFAQDYLTRETAAV
jgi:Xaa-Pro aminopeptidase